MFDMVSILRDGSVLPREERDVDLTEESTASLIERAADSWRRISGAQHMLLQVLTELDRRGIWHDAGAHDMAHWVGNAFGLSRYRASRWLDAGRSLEELPRIAEAFEQGDLSVYKVEELARFATPEEEDAILEWAKEEPSGAIKAEADRRRGNDAEEIASMEERRWLGWRYGDDGRGFYLQAGLPSADGAIVAQAIDDLLRKIPALPDETAEQLIGARRADALVVLCSTRRGEVEPDRAGVVVHAHLDTLLDAEAVATTSDGAVLPAPAVQRLLCNGSVRTLIEDADGTLVGATTTARDPSPGMMRQLRYRDGTCRFPNCHLRRFTQAHHVEWWSRGGRTELGNLILVCTFHHKLVHERGWGVKRRDDGAVHWFRPDGTRYRAGQVAA
jgi:Domain of unknown function (DUF222)